MLKQLVELSRDEESRHRPKQLFLAVWQMGAEEHKSVKDEIRKLTSGLSISIEFEDADSLKAIVRNALDSTVKEFEAAGWMWD